MFEVVQFFNIKDISQLATTSDIHTTDAYKNSKSNEDEDSFESSDVSYARDTDSQGHDAGEDAKDNDDIMQSMANMTMTKQPQ